MVCEAVKLVKDQVSDWSIYDWGGDGPVAVGTDLWVDSYACGSELNGNGKICGIGTMCHEFSHCLGFPDFYDTDYSGAPGTDNWDLMCSGNYCGNGYQPVGYTSYELMEAGWLEPIKLESENVTVENMKSAPTIPPYPEASISPTARRFIINSKKSRIYLVISVIFRTFAAAFDDVPHRVMMVAGI